MRIFHWFMSRLHRSGGPGPFPHAKPDRSQAESDGIGLERYYRGDQDFADTARGFRALEGPAWMEWEQKDTLIEQCGGDADIAVMIFATAGQDRALAYLDGAVPALEGETPRSCMRDDALLKRLKVMLTRAVGR